MFSLRTVLRLAQGSVSEEGAWSRELLLKSCPRNDQGPCREEAGQVGPGRMGMNAAPLSPGAPRVQSISSAPATGVSVCGHAFQLPLRAPGCLAGGALYHVHVLMDDRLP